MVATSDEKYCILIKNVTPTALFQEAVDNPDLAHASAMPIESNHIIEHGTHLPQNYLFDGKFYSIILTKGKH